MCKGASGTGPCMCLNGWCAFSGCSRWQLRRILPLLRLGRTCCFLACKICWRQCPNNPLRLLAVQPLVPSSCVEMSSCFPSALFFKWVHIAKLSTRTLQSLQQWAVAMHVPACARAHTHTHTYTHAHTRVHTAERLNKHILWSKPPRVDCR